MRRWSEELVEDREFEIGGELFKWMYPHWEVGAKLFDDDMTPAETNGEGQQQFSFLADTKLAIERIPLFLDPANDSHKKWKALMARKTNAVPRYQIVQLYRWLVQVTGGLPTTPPSDADSGAGGNDAGSSDASSSTEATPTA